jgi:hypothetical protein
MLKTEHIKALWAITGLFITLCCPGQSDGTTQQRARAAGDTAYSFLVAGHAYGAHAGGNLGLHPALLDRLDAGIDSLAAFIVLTGDIVNSSTAESWEQVENELSAYPLPSWYVMGNHDNNQVGNQVFLEKHGAAYYTFRWQSDLFIVLNSTQEERSIPPVQLAFLEQQILQAGDSTRNVFIFFHELLWNSHEKYAGVRSNSRSRYDQIVNYSNYWEDVHPLLAGFPGIRFSLVAGDLGANTDAVAAFYDRWDHITLIASGMGEVADENYLLVRMHGDDPPAFKLVPLNEGITLPDIGYFSVPPAPGPIAGPAEVETGSTGNEYTVPEVFNATSYLWELPQGLSGTSATNLLLADADSLFAGGTLSVRAERDGFGHGEASTLFITATEPPVGIPGKDAKPGTGAPQVELLRGDGRLVIQTRGLDGGQLTVRISDILGRLVWERQVDIPGDGFLLELETERLPDGILFVCVSIREVRTAIFEVLPIPGTTWH